MKLDYVPVEWKSRAACRTRTTGDPDQGLDFVMGDDSLTPMERFQNVRQCLDVCAGCAVIAECGEYAVEAKLEYGIWGGEVKGRR